MALWNRSIGVTQNSDDSFIFGFGTADPSGQLSLTTPYSFVGGTFEFTASLTSDPTSTQLIQLTGTYAGGGSIVCGTATINTAPVATLSFTVPHATSVNFPVGTFYYDLLWKNGSVNTYLMAGSFVVSPSISR